MDRFDLEKQISETYNFTNYLDNISYGIAEMRLTNDDIINAISGLSVILKIHIDKLFDTYKQLYKLDQYNTIHCNGRSADDF